LDPEPRLTKTETETTEAKSPEGNAQLACESVGFIVNI